MSWLDANGRRIHRVAIAAAPLLVAYGVISDKVAPLWVALLAAVLIPSPIGSGDLEDDGDPEIGESLADPDPEG